MKKAIYIFSLYTGSVAFFTLFFFQASLEVNLTVTLLAVLLTGVVVFLANRHESNRFIDNI